MRKFRRIFLIFFTSLIFVMFVSGCTDFKDLNDKIIVTTVAVYKKDGEIYFNIEIANIEEVNKSSETGVGQTKKFDYIIGHGKTIPDARDNLDNQITKELFLSSVRMLILTEEFAKDYLVEYLYRIRAEELYRKKTLIVITNEDPEELIKLNNESNRSVGFTLEEMLETLEKLGKTVTKTTSELIETISSSYSGFIIPFIGLEEKNNILLGYSILNDSTISGFIPVEKTRGIMYILAKDSTFVYHVPYKDEQFTIEVNLKKREIKPKYDNGKISFNLKFDFNAELMYGSERTPYHFDKVKNKEVTEILTEMLKKEIYDNIKQAQNEFNHDYLQFNEEFRIKYPEEYDKLDWQIEFPQANFNINADVNLTFKWMMDYEINKIK